MANTPAHHLPDQSDSAKDCTVGEFFRDVARKIPDQLALIVPATRQGEVERRWTYRELEVEAERIALALLTHFEPGDNVATFLGGSVELVPLHMGAAIAGVVLVTLNPSNRAAELSYLLSQSEAKGLFLNREFRGMDNVELLEQIREDLPALRAVTYMDEWDEFLDSATLNTFPEVQSSDPAMILFTSGTTGKPKGAVLSHKGVVSNACLSTERLEMPLHSTWLNVFPMFHVAGSVTLTLGTMANLGTQVMLPEFKPADMLAAIETYRVGITMAVPTMLVAAMEDENFLDTDVSSLEVIVTGATVVAPELVREVTRRWDTEVMVMFGQTETGGCMCLTRRGDGIERITQSVGRPLPLTEAKIINPETQKIIEHGAVGEICVRAPGRMLEYFNMPGKTAEAVDADGWVHTGDLGVMSEDGYIQITGRLKDMIIRGGENIYPREIEDLLVEHPAISQAAVFGIPDANWGEQVAAAVIFKPGHSDTEESLMNYLRERIARHKVPKLWRFVDSLPVNASGKVMKFVLREQTEKEKGGAA